MRKRTGLFLLLFCLILSSLCLTIVHASGNGGIYDEYGALSEEETSTLEEQISQIYQSSGVDAAILITKDVGYTDARKYAAEYMQEHGIGPDNGVILMHQPESREITIVFRGEIQNSYSVKIQDILLEDCKGYLRENDFFGGYQAVLQEISNSVERAVSGAKVRKMDLTGEGILSSLPGFGAISVLFSAIPVFCMSLFQRGRMKTKVQQANANSYVPVNGLKLRRKEDHYIRTVRTKTKKEKNHDSGGGHSGSFSSGGEHFSGSSSKY